MLTTKGLDTSSLNLGQLLMTQNNFLYINIYNNTKGQFILKQQWKFLQ
jgi:hypothetical protein